MLRNNTHDQYGRVSQCLHAFLAVLVLGLLCVGAWMTGLPKTEPLKFIVYNLHKLAGVTTLLFGLIFVAWSVMNVKPKWPSTMPRWERMAATAVHHSLKMIVVLMPLSGWVMSTAAGHAPKIAGMPFPCPTIPENKILAHWANTTHYLLAWFFTGLIAIHIAASLKHHFFERDNILRRMWFG